MDADSMFSEAAKRNLIAHYGENDALCRFGYLSSPWWIANMLVLIHTDPPIVATLGYQIYHFVLVLDICKVAELGTIYDTENRAQAWKGTHF
jgi:hypothetical protein